MISFKIILNLLLLAQVFTAPTPGKDDFCSGEEKLYKYESGKQYRYDYETDTTLWINDVSDEAKSAMNLKVSVLITPVAPCTYQLKLQRSSLSGESLTDSASVHKQLNNFDAVFRLNPQGELDSEVKFQPGDKAWSRNIKRGIISALQVKSESHLRTLDYLSSSELKSATVYESDVLGRCRTTYSLNSGSNANSVKLNKQKSLQRCTLNTNSKTSAIQFVPYKTLPEFFQGRLFIESYACDSVVENNVLSSVECKETSTYRIGSRGRLGTQAVVKQTLKFVQATSGLASPQTDSYETMDIQFEYDNSVPVEVSKVNAAQFAQDICDKGITQGLTTEHSDNFRDLVKLVRSSSVADLKALYEQSNAKCSLAGLTVSQALTFADTDNSLEVVLSLLDKDAFNDQKYITEYPILTALARNQNPSEQLLTKLRGYLSAKSGDFPYLNKLYLVYSTLVKTHCSKHECSTSKLDNWSSLFASNLADNCANKAKSELVISSLKAIGNIGYFKEASVLAKCATNKASSLEVRVNAIQSLRRFSCEQLELLSQNYDLLQDVNEDAEIRINAFLSLVRCSDQSSRFKQFAETKLAEFLLAENDVQVLTYIIDYGKEHSLTSILNTVLNEPRIKEKFSVNFKELSWNNYKYRYSVMRDSAFEVDTSVIYTAKTFVPRSVRFNVTMHMFGMSINFLDATLRLEGLDEILKASIIDKLKSEQLLQKIMQKPEKLLDILKLVADKLKYVSEKPLISLSVRLYGADVFYSRLDSSDELKKFASFLKGPRANLYRQVLSIRNLLLIDSNVKQPLANGFEFETAVDISAALLVSKSSTKETDDDEIDFDLNNFYSSSLSINRKYDVQINEANRLSLKKKSVFNGRLRLDLDGQKKNGSATYSLNLSPVASLPLVTLDGRFYKLGANSQYNEIKQFKVEQTVYNGCTNDKFQTAFGVNLCYSVQRPKASLKEAFKYFQLEDVEQVNDDDEEDETVTRPSLLLSGPYTYKIVLENPDLVKSITFSANFHREEAKKEFNALLSIKSLKGEEKKTLQMIYTREKVITNRGLSSRTNFEMRRPATNEVRLQALAEFEYRKDEVLAGNFLIDNKIGKELNIVLNFGRNKTESNIVPNYYLEALINSKIVDSKVYRISADIKPEGRNIETNFLIEKQDTKTQNQNVKLFKALLSLKAVDENNDSELDYNLNFNAESARKGALKITGRVFATLLHSNIDISLDYSNPSFKLPKLASIKLGHFYDGAAGAKSYLEFKVDVPLTPINHGSKLVFTYNLETAKFDYVEVLLSKPDRDQPISIFFERSNNVIGLEKKTDLTFGLRNAQLDLTDSESILSKTLTKVDDQEILKSLIIHFVRIHDKEDKEINVDFHVKKNDKTFIVIQYNLKGDLNSIRKSTTEVARQQVSGDLSVKVMDNSGKISSKLDFESSAKNNKHFFDFEFKTENLFKMLFKIASINSAFSLQNNKLNAQVDIQKVGDVKGFKIVSKSDVRSSGDAKEFDVSFEKKLANNQVLSGAGIARYTFKDFKNFETSIQVPNHYESKMSLATKRSNTDDLFAFHDFKFSIKHLSGTKYERELNVLINNKTESQGNTLALVASLRRGDLNQLKNRNKLDLLFDLNAEFQMTKNQDGSRSLTSIVNNLDTKSKRFSVDLTKNFKASTDSKTKVTKAEGSTKFSFPALFTDPGKINKLTHNYKYSRNTNNNEISFKNDYETDSKLFGRYFKVLNIDLSRKVLSAKNIKGHLNVDYKLPSDQATDKLKSFKATLEHDYINAKINLKQNRLPQIKSMFKSNQVIDISDCTVNVKYERQKTASNYLLDTLFDLECLNRKLTSNKVYINRSGKTTDAPATKIELTTQSDLYYEVKSVSLAHEKFTTQNGLASYRIQQNEQTSYANEFSFKRSLNKAGKLESAHYQLNSEIGSIFSKKCELNIEAKTDYYNSLNCRLNTTRVPNIELNYGYNLKLENPFDYLSGRRGVQLDVIVPGRALRAIYKSNYATPIDGTDDDDDENDEREFNGTATIQWNFLKEPTKLITLNLKRDNYAKGKSLFFVEAANHPSFNQLRFQVDRIRTVGETVVNTAALYQLKNGNTNRLDLTLKMSSDLDTNTFSIETNLQRPSVNTLYENRYNKNNGRLEYLAVRLGKLIKLTIDKESGPEQRRVALNLINPDETKYTIAARTNTVDSKHIVEGTLNKGSTKLSSVLSTFDSNNNNFDVQVKGVSNSYKFNFGLFNETLANAHVLNENSGIVLGLATLQMIKNEEYNDLVLSLKWNRLWSDIQRDLLGENLATKAQEDEKFNSYLGDVYAELSNDLKQSVDSFRKERQAVANDIRNIVFIVVDSYSKYLPANLRNEDRSSELKSFVEMQMANTADDTPLYKRFFKSYNEIAQRLLTVSLKVRKYSKSLSRMVPRLPLIEYNKEQITKEFRPFSNNLIVSRPTLYARNLYQFNAEYRDYIRNFGERVLFAKRSLTRNANGISVKALVNKYKYRSLKDYTLVANVYNKRNIIGFDGESRTLQSKCRYLLAHETHKNRFSVVLNFNDNQYPISVYAYGSKSFDISFTRAAINNKAVSLPQTIKLENNNVLTMTKTNVGVCVELNHDLKVCCYEDSSSCTIALTRWYTGKINGLLGQANNNPQDNINENDWYLEKQCKYPNSQLKKPSLDAIKTCHATFGRHRKSLFRHAIMAIRPNGWQRVCETVLSVDPKAKCLLMKAFDHHADQENVKIEAPNDCFTCSANSKQHSVGQSLTANDFESGSDYVFLTLPCDKSKFGIDLNNLVSKLKSKNPSNKYYVVSVDEHDASIYQSDSNEISNFDLKKAYETLSDDVTLSVSKTNFNKGLFLAASLFSKRLAQNRFLIIRSCGNCLLYSVLDTLKYARKVTDRNVIVHSWGDYDIKNLESDDSEDVPVGYDEDNVYLYKPSENSVDTDTLDSYKIEHKADLCQRLAVKTHGSVLNINYLRNGDVLSKVTEWLEEPVAKFEYKVKKCQKFDTPYGDLMDFLYKRTKIESDD